MSNNHVHPMLRDILGDFESKKCLRCDANSGSRSYCLKCEAMDRWDSYEDPTDPNECEWLDQPEED